MTDAPEPTTAEQTDQPETDWKAEARKWEQRAKDNARTAKENQTAAQRLAEIEESSKSELQKAVEARDAALKRVQEFESERQVSAWKTEVAAETGVPVEWLRGSTREELAAHAEVLKPAAPSARGPQVPSPGNIPDHPVSEDAQFAHRLFSGE